MAIPKEVQGQRIKDYEYPDEPGQYSKCVHTDDNGNVYTYWFVKAPSGGASFKIGRPNADGSRHLFVEENEDGTITVRPNPPGDPDNSNSILWNGWHGYIYGGVWRTT